MSGACGCGCGGHDERHAPEAHRGSGGRPPGKLGNPPGRTALDYRVGEYGSFLAAMLDRLASPAYPALRGLTVRTPDDPALGLLDSWAVVGDLLTFHSERIADEGYLRTANEYRSLALLGRLVGHRPRPGIAADTHLAYTLDRDPRAEDVPVLIPRGARSNSVPTTSDEESQAFETSEDLIARWAWNELAVRRRRPALFTADDLRKRSGIYVSGTGTSLQTGDKLLFVFGGDQEAGGQRLLLPVARIRIDRDDDVTAIGLPQSAPPSLTELVAELREWITEDDREAEEGEPTPDNPNPRPVSMIIEQFDAQVLAPLRADLDGIKTPAQFARRLADPHDRLAEAQAIAAPYEEVAAWFEQLEAVVGELMERAADLEPSQPVPPTPAAGVGSAAMRALGAVLPALRTRVVRPPSGARTLSHDPGRYFAPGSDLGAQLLSALDPRVADGMYAAWRQAAPAVPALLREVQSMRVTAAPFGATAPLKPVQDDRGRVIRQTDWPLTGSALTTMRVVYDPAGRVPVRAEFQHTETGDSEQRSENLPAGITFGLGPGRVSLQTRAGQDHDLSWLTRRPADSQEPGVTAQFFSGLPERTIFVSRPAEDGRVHVAVHNGEPLNWLLSPGEHKQVAHGGFEVTVRYTVGSEPANVEVGITTVPEQANRHVLPLDSVQDSITVGSWVAIERPRKGAQDPDGIPGDAKLKFVTSRVTAVRTAAYTNYGITGRGTELTLADPWLDEHDVLLSAIRDATVHAGGVALRPADEPLGEDVHGNELELAELYDGLRPGRHLVVSGERTDIPDTAGVRGTELAVIASVEQQFDPLLPGDHVHTRLTLTTDLAYRYRRDTVRIQGNVVPATHGESRDEPIGGGDADRTNQTFTLWQSPLTWLPADNPLGATPTLEVRVDGLLWHGVDSLAGRGPRERVYVSGTAGDGRTTVTFGDGVHGARLPTGHENVRAQYRFGTGKAANVRADRITQTITRPLGVTAVTNPQPATGGADGDGPGLTRRTIPLAVSALDRLVSLTDYEDFARSRAGIGRAAAREIFDGRRRVLHVTVAGVDDIAIAEDSEVLRALRSSLAEYGDSRLPVRVDVRELVLLLLAAKVKVARDHTWTVVEPRLRQALLREFGSGLRELGRPARLSDVLATAHKVPGVDYVDVDLFTGVPASVTPDELTALAGSLAEPRTAVGARLADYDEDVHRVTAKDGETLTRIAARHGIALAELLRLNPDITDTRRLAKGRAVFVFRGIRPAQLALLSPHVADTLILTEVNA
ncbi:putative baseplate assembly protein [Streptomyces lunaelactis]|uniref:putative baseplate assembly protein n=1 Tax=Streptomyces lunaelactis TaxID=1535768 RepID=UPI001585208A|nr:putative baseplate assembly protein [Streptomyces lunaelactis]NUK07388.1 putative baseplate assembly protein [Streptomyces lunaelactis]NUL09413.1 putative baseplate assembly protein [Streptomyces lunaelactis]NUL22219.1 putative baseplate assembly protein [Streptomyces lunaelactis]